MAELTETTVVDDLARMIGELSSRQAELLECLRDIRRAHGPEDLGIPAPVPAPVTTAISAPATTAIPAPPVVVAEPSPQVPAVAGPPLHDPGVVTVQAASTALPPAMAGGTATGRHYDYFSALDARLAALAEGSPGEEITD
jgi:hypothetical protein